MSNSANLKTRQTGWPLARRLAENWPVTHDAWFGCWLWTGPTNSNGYPATWSGAGMRDAHVIVWEQENGHEVPEGKVLDHLCRRRLCVNPRHLEPVTQRENLKRRKAGYRSSHMTQCAAGHDLFTHGRRTPEGGVVCRRCS